MDKVSSGIGFHALRQAVEGASRSPAESRLVMSDADGGQQTVTLVPPQTVGGRLMGWLQGTQAQQPSPGTPITGPIQPAVRGNQAASMNAQDVRQREDGNWVVRGSISQAFTSVRDAKADEGISRLREPATSLFTVEFVIDPGQSGEAPKLVDIQTSGVYNSGTRQLPRFEPAEAMPLRPDTKTTAAGQKAG